MKRQHLTLLFMLLSLMANAIQSHPMFRHFDVRDGIGDNYIKSLSRDSYGRLWIVSDGITVFDGHTFHNLHLDSGIKASRVVFGNDGSKWCKGPDGIALLKGDKFSDCSAELAEIGIRHKANDIYASAVGDLYFVAADTLFFYEPGAQRLSAMGLNGIKVSDAAPAMNSNGLVYVTDGNGNLFALNAKNTTKSTIAETGMAYSRIKLTPAGDIMMYGWPLNGVLRVDAKNGAHTGLPVCSKYLITDIGSLPDGRSIIATNHNGLIELDPKGDVMRVFSHERDDPFSLGSNHITSVLNDGDILAVGTAKSGLSLAAASGPEISLHHVAVNEDISAIHECSDGTILMGTDGKGLLVMTERGNGMSAKIFDNSNSDLTSSAVIGIEEWPGGILLGTYGGGIYNYIDGEIKQLQPLSDSPNYVRHMISMPDGTLWAGTFSKGLHKVGSSSFTTDNSVLKSNCITGLTALSDTLLVSTGYGIYMVPKGYSKPTIVPGNELLGCLSANTTYSDKRGLIWVGTTDGLYIFDRKFKSISHLTIENGLSDNTVRAITEDLYGDIWVTGNNGLSRIRTDLTEGRCKFSVSAILASNRLGDITFNRYSISCLKDGSILAGALGKYLRIVSPKVSPRVPKNDVKLSAIIIENSRLTLAGNENADMVSVDPSTPFALEFSTFDLAYPEHAFLEYSLDGADWTKLNGYRCQFDGGLSPCKHNLKIRLIGTADATELTIDVATPWWRSTAALVIYVFLFLVMSLFAAKSYADRQKRRLKREMIEKTLQRQENAPLNRDEQFLADVRAMIDANIDDDTFGVEKLSEAMSMSRSSLYKKLQAVTGKTPIEFIRLIRIREGKRIIDSEGCSVSQTAFKVGISPKQFARYFKEEYGMLPSEYMAKAQSGTGHKDI